jgi:hypothetical protein
MAKQAVRWKREEIDKEKTNKKIDKQKREGEKKR